LKAALVAPTGESPRPTPTPTTPPAQPPVVSSGDWQAEARDRAARQGFGHAVLHEWDWRSTVPQFDTATRGQVGERGVLVISFVPTGPADGVLAFVDAVGYPAPTQNNQLTLSISTVPIDFTVAEPAISRSIAPTVTFCVGDPPRRWSDNVAEAVGLVPGQRYFVNVTGRDSYEPGKFGGPEFRVALRVPQGH
jgi:hypothetical protein